jgi:hypothetical protein
MQGAKYEVRSKGDIHAKIDEETLLHLGRCLKAWCSNPANLPGWETATRRAFNDCRDFFEDLEKSREERTNALLR